ncbi:Pro-Pol polyprotein, partial [Mucuna pruriens]
FETELVRPRRVYPRSSQHSTLNLALVLFDTRKTTKNSFISTHVGGRALASKIVRAGYYWPTLKKDCMEYVRRCNKCQRFAEAPKAPAEPLHSVSSPWPFNKWGVDILGPFPMTLGQLKLLIVAVDYFTKWIEAEPIVTITVERVKHFLWKKIVCRFGIPAEVVSDNGTQFASRVMADFCRELQIRQSFTSVEHPQSNGQVEAANKVILRGLWRCLEETKGRWSEELPQVLWSYHTTPHSTTNETPFRLTFGSDAVIPVEIGEPSPWTTFFEPVDNEEELRANLDMLQEVHEVAHIREYAVKARIAGRYNRKTIPRNFHPQDLVLRRITIVEEVGRGAYRLEHLDGRRIPRTWNAAMLQMYYS